MDEYADIYYVDSRNAGRDHRTQGGSPSSGGYRPPGPPPPRTTTVYVPPTAQPIPQAPVIYGQPTTGYLVPQGQAGYLVPQGQYLLPQQQSPLGNLFGKLTTGQVIEMVAQLFAALQPLPAAPVPTRSEVDSGNNILFQDALAKHAKRDEQIRTLGALVSRLVG